jgi:hypothetical protein
MTAIPVAIADAVAEEINTARLADQFAVSDFDAVRSYADWDEKYEGLDRLAVDVVFVATQQPGSIDLVARGFIEYQHSVDIAVRKRFGTADRGTDGRLKNASVDPLIELVQQLHEHFAARRTTGVLDDLEETNWEGANVSSWVSYRKLRQGLFEGVVRIRFLTRKAL